MRHRERNGLEKYKNAIPRSIKSCIMRVIFDIVQTNANSEEDGNWEYYKLCVFGEDRKKNLDRNQVPLEIMWKTIRCGLSRKYIHKIKKARSKNSDGKMDGENYIWRKKNPSIEIPGIITPRPKPFIGTVHYWVPTIGVYLTEKKRT